MYNPFKQSPTKKLWLWVIKLIVQRELDNRKWQNGRVSNSKAETYSCAGCELHKGTQPGSQWGLKSCLQPPGHMQSDVHLDRTPFPCVHKGRSGHPVAPLTPSTGPPSALSQGALMIKAHLTRNSRGLQVCLKYGFAPLIVTPPALLWRPARCLSNSQPPFLVSRTLVLQG